MEKEIQIVKNKGQKEPLNIDKIYSHLQLACEGLNVSQVDIIKNAKLKFYDGMKSSVIQDSLIQSAQEMISLETPDYEIVAGRLLNQKIRKECYGQFEPLNFKDEVKKRIKAGHYTKDLLNYTDEELDFLGSKIKYKLDDEFQYAALRQIYTKYLIKNNNTIIETPQEIFMLIPMAIFYKSKDLKLIVDGYNLLSQRKISLPTPIMNGARNSYKHFISCNLINAGDSTLSLSKAAEMVMRCTAAKSGIGLNLSFIRGLGASIGKPERVKHTGILPLIKTYEAATASLTQTVRGGSLTATLPFYHYEVELFSQLSDSKGTVETRARHTDQSIIINRWFLKKALNKEDIYLFHMNEVPLLYNELGTEKFDEIYENYAKKVPARHKKKVNAWDLLELFIYERIISGRLYFVFADNFYKGSYKENLYMSNLCQEVAQPCSSLDGYNIHTQKHDDTIPEIGVCILSNMNLGYAKLEDIPKCANFLVRFLDEMIDVDIYNIPEAEYAAKKRRGLGIGISNLFGYLAKSKQFYNTADARESLHEIMECFCYYLTKTSIQLAKENTEYGADGEITKHGRCELFGDTVYSDFVFPFERFKNNKHTNYSLKMDWEALRQDLQRYGIRNSSLMAVPPAGNSAEVSNSTNGVEPPRELLTKKTDKNQSYKKLVPFYKTSKNYYTTAWSMEFNNSDYFKLISVVQKFVDQAISLNQYTSTLNSKDSKIKISDIIGEMILSLNLGIKTWYYQNFRTTDDIDGLVDKIEGCESGGCSV